MGRRKKSGAHRGRIAQQNAERKQQQLERLQATLASKGKAKHVSDAEQTQSIEPYDPESISFLRRGSLSQASLTPSLAVAVRDLRDAIVTGQSGVFLAWPSPLPGAAILHGIAMLCELAEGPDHSRGLTTLFYPASARTGASQKGLLVDRDWLMDANTPWRNAFLEHLQSPRSGRDYTQARFHYFISRLADLRPAALEQFQRGQSVVRRAADRAHPILHELVPRRALQPSGDVVPPHQTFLNRSRRLSKLLAAESGGDRDQLAEAVDPLATPWLMSTVHGASPVSSWNTVSAAGRRKPDIILMDLQRRARARLGVNWQADAKRALARLRHGDMELPVFVITDDPFVAGFAKREFAPQPKGRARKKPWPVSFSLNSESTVLSEPVVHDVPTSPSRPLAVEVQIFGSDLAQFAGDAMHLRRQVLKIADGVISRAISVCVSRLRAMANSPLSQSQISDALDDPQEPHSSRRVLQTFSVGDAIAELKSVAPRADRYEGKVESLAEHARVLATALSSSANETSGLMLRTRIESLVRRSTRTLVVAQSAAVAQLLEAWIETDPELEAVAERLGAKFEIAAPQEARDRVVLAAQSTKPFVHLLLLSAPPWALFPLIADPRCPAHVDVLADASSAKFAAIYGRALLRHWPEGNDFRARICDTVGAFDEALVGQVADLPDFDLGDAPSAAVAVTDLTSNTGKANSRITRITSVDGEIIHANPDTVFVTRRKADLEQFENVPAKRLAIGREILVPGPRFLEQVLNAKQFRAAAVPLLEQYHAAVRLRASELPGATLKDKAALLLEKMELPDDGLPTVSSVERWLSVDRQADVPAELRLPQAPRTQGHFLAFSEALGIDRPLANVLWLYAILATRGVRIRSGFQMRKLYMSALIEPGALIRKNPAAKDLVDLIRDLADEHISEIAHIETRTEALP